MQDEHETRGHEIGALRVLSQEQIRNFLGPSGEIEFAAHPSIGKRFGAVTLA
jgi:hypothetical protein